MVYVSWAAVKDITSFLFDILKGGDFPQKCHADQGSQYIVVIGLMYGMSLCERKKLSMPMFIYLVCQHKVLLTFSLNFT